MIRTHVVTWVCGRAVLTWRYLTFAQWRSLPNVSWRIGKAVAIVACSGTIGLAIPPLLDTSGPPWPSWRPSPAPHVDVPEPLSLAVFGVGLGALGLVRGAKRLDGSGVGPESEKRS